MDAFTNLIDEPLHYSKIRTRTNKVKKSDCGKIWDERLQGGKWKGNVLATRQITHLLFVNPMQRKNRARLQITTEVSHSRRSIIFNIILYNIFIDPKQVAIIQSRLKNTIEIVKYQQL